MLPLAEVTGSERGVCVFVYVCREFAGACGFNHNAGFLVGAWRGDPWDVPFVYGRNLKTNVV